MGWVNDGLGAWWRDGWLDGGVRAFPFSAAARYHVVRMQPDTSMGKLKKIGIQAARAIEPTPRTVGRTLHGALNAAMPERYDPRIMAKGGEHLVFRFNEPFRRELTETEKKGGKKAVERPRDIVYKINFYDTGPILEAVASGDETKVKRALDKMRDKIEDKRRSLEDLREYFGFDAVPAQQYMIRDVPITEAVVAAVRPDLVHKASGLRSVPAWVEVQRKLDLGPALSVNGYYPEAPQSQVREQRSEEEYRQIFDAGHDVLTGGPLSEMDRESQLRHVLEMYPDLAKVASRAEEDPSFREGLRQLSDKLMDFIEDTGIALDLAGKDNMVIVKRGDKWSVRFPDVLAPGDFSFINLKMVLELMRQGQGVGARGRLVALNLVNTVRVVNALALISGNDRRLHYKDLAAIPPEAWREEMAKVFSP